jgi:hypothetical protein
MSTGTFSTAFLVPNIELSCHFPTYIAIIMNMNFDFISVLYLEEKKTVKP